MRESELTKTITVLEKKNEDLVQENTKLTQRLSEQENARPVVMETSEKERDMEFNKQSEKIKCAQQHDAISSSSTSFSPLMSDHPSVDNKYNNNIIHK